MAMAFSIVPGPAWMAQASRAARFSWCGASSATAGHALPRWSATAAIMGMVLDRL